MPQEAKLGMPVLTIQGAAIGVPASKPRARAADAKTVVEEHFAGGWTEWTGGVDDWKLDAAGVRTGSLALFRPSLDLADYDLEFLARIENRSVSWVFRAEGFDRYQLATIALAPDGGYELTRCTVLEGTAGPPASLRVARPGRARQALTVRTRASGGDFTISIDGKRVDHWTDSRLAAGGVGFVGTPEDRARLYWIRLSYGGPVRSQA